ncbi:MFS transporter [Amycolatopsis acidiphila]|uniref:MFS transporter n=1 Tax=Amycolatopsis acidiphila TaxID=715473 RepID=A0A558A5J7_9PSEU|nr:MFS transporter [Amycolatopsis acidiphila]TVT19520.1 MFS transporter [Amycolatopsis acidiphila]UIJ56888.1 MFS transporter [Amycolatopsis acidiphila]GHG54546.1 MFS transporter [Amycolatopsis acidiphila]
MAAVRRYWREQVPPLGPFRVLALGVLVTTAGEGAWYTTWAVYFTTAAGLPAASVGLGLLLAGAVALLAATPVGALADRLGPRTLLAVLIAVEGVSMAAFLCTSRFAVFLPVAVVNTVADRAAAGVRTAYVAGLADAGNRVGHLARQRVASHVGYTVGAAGGALCLSLHTAAAFHVVIVLNAATSLFHAALLARMPVVPAARVRTPALARDPAFLAVATTTGLLSLCWGLVSTALPLWLLRNTGLPTALAGAVVIVNSLGVALLQVPASRGCTTVRRAAARALWSGAALAGACLVLAATAGGHGLLAAGLVLVAAGAHLAGELWFIAARWTLTLDLTPAGATGRYQGVTATAEAAAQMLSPAVMTVLIGTWGRSGWFVLAAVFLAAGAATVPATRWAVRTRTNAVPGAA